jgi:endonuclease/exonuclease/phosphatase family metal-dependent hydrolase
MLVTSFGLQLLRSFIPGLAWYLRDTVGAGTLDLIPYAFGTFFLGFLAALLRRMLNDRLSLWICGAGLAILRLVEGFSNNPELDFWLAIGGVGLFLNFIPLFIGHTRALGESHHLRWSLGFGLGFAFDFAIRVIFGARDLSTVSGWIPLAITLLITILILWALWKEPRINSESPSDISGKNAVQLLAIGSIFTIQMLFLSSQGWFEQVTGIPYPGGYLAILVGYVVMVGGIVLANTRPRSIHPLITLILSLYLVYGTFSAESYGYQAVIYLFVGQFIMGWGLGIISKSNSRGNKPGLWRTTLATAGGMILFLAFSFAFYIGQDMALPIPRVSFPAIAGGIFGILVVLASFQTRTKINTTKQYSGIVLVSPLLLFPIIFWFIYGSGPKPITPDGYPVKVMDYNIHSAFNVDGSQDLEAIAKVIEDSGADIIGLHEVSRGRLMDGSADMPTWLANRLDMQMVFRGTDEPIWGNAILTRFPILESGWGELPKDGSLIKRGYLWAKIDIGEDQPLLVIVTHLHQIVEDPHVRLAQVPVLLEFWDGKNSSILMGDFNAKPDSEEISLLYLAGLLDSWLQAGDGPGYTVGSNYPFKRIDFIWHSPDLNTYETEVIQTQASDHMPVLVQIGK